MTPIGTMGMKELMQRLRMLQYMFRTARRTDSENLVEVMTSNSYFYPRKF